MLRQILSITILAATVLSSSPSDAKPYMAEKYQDRAGTAIQVIRSNGKVIGTVVKPLNGRARVTAKKTKDLKGGNDVFEPQPNDPPVSTGGTGTRATSKPKQPIVYPQDRTPKFPRR